MTARPIGDWATRRVESAEVALDAPYGGLVGGDPEGVAPALPVLQPHVAELGVQDAAVPVPYGERPVPGSGAVHHLVEEGDDQSRCCSSTRAAPRTGRAPPGGVAEQLLCLGAPQRDPALVVEHHGGDAEEVEEARPGGRTGGLGVRSGPEGIRLAHAGPSFPPPTA